MFSEGCQWRLALTEVNVRLVQSLGEGVWESELTHD